MIEEWANQNKDNPANQNREDTHVQNFQVLEYCIGAVPTRVIYIISINTNYLLGIQLRPYTLESTGSRPISEVKLVMAQSVLWWGTTREYWVL